VEWTLGKPSKLIFRNTLDLVPTSWPWPPSRTLRPKTKKKCFFFFILVYSKHIFSCLITLMDNSKANLVLEKEIWKTSSSDRIPSFPKNQFLGLPSAAVWLSTDSYCTIARSSSVWYIRQSTKITAAWEIRTFLLKSIYLSKGSDGTEHVFKVQFCLRLLPSQSELALLTLPGTARRSQRRGSGLRFDLSLLLDSLRTTQGLHMDGEMSSQQRLWGWDRE